MNILVVSQYYKPERFRIDEICEFLVTKGHSVTVLTGLPNYNTGIIPPEYRHGKNRVMDINGVHVIRTLEISRKTGTFRLALNYLCFMVSSSVKSLFLNKNFDLVFVYQLSPVTMILPAVVYKKINKKKLVIYSLDLWPESIRHIIKSEKNIIFITIKKFSKYLYKQADCIMVSSKPFIDYYNKVHTIALEKLNYVPQHAIDIYENLEVEHHDSRVEFLYLGNIGLTNDVETIIKAINKIPLSLNFMVNFVGEGTDAIRIKQLVNDYGLESRITFHGQYPQSEMPRFLSKADACLLTLKADHFIGETIPGKLQGYMAAGKPVLAAISGPAQGIITESKCGVYVEASDYIGLSKLMVDFIENKEKYKECGPSGRAYFMNNYTIESFVQALESQFEMILKEEN